MKDDKIYFKLVQEENWDYYFESKKWDRLRFAWGWNGKRKFIIGALMDKFGQKEWAEIFDKFLQWLDHIQNISEFKGDTWVFVLYPQRNVTNNNESWDN